MTKKQQDLIKKLAEDRQKRHEEEKKRVQRVRDRFPDVRWPNVYSRPAAFVDGSNVIHIDDRVAIVGDTVADRFNGETQQWVEEPHTAFYAFASKQYKIEPHEEALLKMEDVLSGLSKSEYGRPAVTPVIFGDGGRMKVTVDFPDVKYEVGKRKEPLTPRLEMRNSYDLSWEFMIRFGARQMVCSNGLYAHKTLQQISKKHRRNLDVESVVTQITDYMHEFSEQIGWWDKWAQKKLSETGVQEIMTALDFTEKRQEEILALPLIGRGQETLKVMKEPTLWDVNSAITQFLTHEVESEMVRIEVGERLANVMQSHYDKK